MAKTNYALIRINKIKSLGAMSRIYQHNFRTCYTPNADAKLKEKNKDYIERDNSLDYNGLWEQRIKEARSVGKLSIRKNSVLAYEVLLTYTKTEDIIPEKWAKDSIAWLQEYFGKENVLSAQLHADEPGNFHIHALVVPITKDGRLCAREFTGGRTKMITIQNEYAKAVEKYGLKRGLRNSRAKHTDIKRFYAAINSVVNTRVPMREEGELEEDYQDRVTKFIQDEKFKLLSQLNDKQRELDEERTFSANFKQENRAGITLQNRATALLKDNGKAINELAQAPDDELLWLFEKIKEYKVRKEWLAEKVRNQERQREEAEKNRKDGGKTV